MHSVLCAVSVKIHYHLLLLYIKEAGHTLDRSTSVTTASVRWCLEGGNLWEEGRPLLSSGDSNCMHNIVIRNLLLSTIRK